jgi:hypothetical protein
VAHAWTDPLLAGDADGSGLLSAADAFLIVQEGLGISEPFVPDNPHLQITPAGTGIDPQFQIGVQLPTTPGGLISVPVTLDIEPGATNVGGFEFDLFFDPSRLAIHVPDGVTAGADMAWGWSLSARLAAPGQLRVGMVSARGQSMSPGSREVARLLFRVESGAAAGVAVLDIEPLDPRAGGYAWTAVDGSVSIAAPTVRRNAANLFDVNGDGLAAPASAPAGANYVPVHPADVNAQDKFFQDLASEWSPLEDLLGDLAGDVES